jgi:hypothetical protein
MEEQNCRNAGSSDDVEQMSSLLFSKNTPNKPSKPIKGSDPSAQYLFLVD